MSGIDLSPSLHLDGMDISVLLKEKGAKSPRTEILLNIDPLECPSDICGGIRVGDWKLVIGKGFEILDSRNEAFWTTIPPSDLYEIGFPDKKRREQMLGEPTVTCNRKYPFPFNPHLHPQKDVTTKIESFDVLFSPHTKR